MKIFAIQRKRTPKQEGNLKKTIEKDPTLTTKENKINRSQFSNRKQIKRKNITSPLKESTKKNKQKIETVITSKPHRTNQQLQNHQTAFLQPSQLQTNHNHLGCLFLFAEEFSEDELQGVFKEVPTLKFPKDIFLPVVKVNSHASSQSKTVICAISSNSDASYTPTPLPAPVHNPTPLNL